MLEDQPWGRKSLQGVAGGDSTELCRAVLSGEVGVLEEPLFPIPTPLREGAALLQWDSSLISAAPLGNGATSCKPQQ